MFRKDLFIEDCKSAVREGQKAVRELVLEAVSAPDGIVAELGEPNRAGVYPLYQAEDLTVNNFVWAPCMTVLPHNHNMFAVIGVYSGREENVLWRRIDDDAGGSTEPGIEAAGAESLGLGQVATLGRDIIHSVANPLTKFTATLQVYGGDFFNPPTPRSQWDHETLVKQPWDMNRTRELFRQAELRYNAGLAAESSL